MRRAVLTLLAPTVAVCKFGCASCCAAPITVFWLAGIVSIVFGLLGGPVGLTGISWTTVALGLTLWGIAALWTAFAIRGTGEALCEQPDSPVCQAINSESGESDSLNEIHSAR